MSNKQFLQETNFEEDNVINEVDEARKDKKLARLANYKRWEQEDQAFLNDSSY